MKQTAIEILTLVAVLSLLAGCFPVAYYDCQIETSASLVAAPWNQFPTMMPTLTVGPSPTPKPK